mgnify:CR=1 FL=1
MYQFEDRPCLARIDYATGGIAYGVLGIVYGNLLFGSVKRGESHRQFSRVQMRGAPYARIDVLVQRHAVIEIGSPFAVTESLVFKHEHVFYN